MATSVHGLNGVAKAEVKQAGRPYLKSAQCRFESDWQTVQGPVSRQSVVG